MTVFDVAGRIKYGTIEGVGQMSITRSRGIQPATIQLMLPNQPEFPSGPSPVFLYDGNNSFMFPDCAFQSMDVQLSDGLECLVTLLDYRWRWQYGQVSGEYNVIRGGLVVPSSKKSVEELARICLKEMGVTSIDVAVLRKIDSLPSVSWDLDNPAQALEALMNQFGCVICPQLNGSVLIAKRGVGKKLPRMIGAEFTGTLKVQTAPDEIHVHAKPTIWEVSIEIGDAVGVERSKPTVSDPSVESVVPIDKLSYTPVTSWEKENPLMFPNVGIKVLPDKDALKELSDFESLELRREADRIRGLAQESIWKLYTFKFPIKLPQLKFEIKDINQIEFLDDLISETVVEYETPLQKKAAEVRRQKPFVYGLFYDQNGFGKNNVEAFSHDYAQDARLIYQGGFSVDKQRGLISFSNPVYLFETKAGELVYSPSRLFLRTAISVREPNSRALWREVLKIKTGYRNDSKPMTLRSDLGLEVAEQADTRKTTDNKKDLEKELRKQLDIEVKKIMPEIPESGSYSGFIPIELDGTIEQVSYQIDSSGFATTTASYGMEHSLVVSSHEERMRIARTEAFIKRSAGMLQNNVPAGPR
ncbi:hypothetical protein VN12_26295 [Pirellula sp. SH-Sr6A]|uniref:hypothetical protein n=1 Tax=Pirellula sp. SH-Sr6A TaxID=1632865 RepID=UPI00078DA8A2|nr:hypothetical protein [Pirellula sp. SH-Sr6A]AMV35630.1 hypothetical protein VN12_26295 [Pirellula sp. SH-Sr6A]